MIIALYVASFPKLSETFIVSKFLGLLRNGWDVFVVCVESEAAQWEKFPELAAFPSARARVVKAWPHRPKWLAALLTPFALGWCLIGNARGTCEYLRKAFRRFGFGALRHLYLDAPMIHLRPDIIHFEFGTLAVDRTHLKDLLDCRIVASFRGYDLNLSGLQQPDYLCEVWQRADCIHVLGEALFRRAQERGCPPDKKVALIPPAIDVDLFTPSRTAGDSEHLRILAAGRLTWEKGLQYAIQAVSLLRDKGISCELRVIGEGPMLEALAFARHQLGLEKFVHFIGALPRTAVRDQMSQSDVFLHPSVSEGFGNVVIEAQAMGLPVVCSDAGGLPENVADEVTGFVVPRRDASALANRLGALAADPGLRRRMGKAGRERVLAQFQLSDQIRAFERLYQEISQRDGGGDRQSTPTRIEEFAHAR